MSTNEPRPLSEQETTDRVGRPALRPEPWDGTFLHEESDDDGDDALEVDRELLGARLDRYQIRALLGRGGMGSVYLAWHDRLHRDCAVKVIAAKLVRSRPDRLQMFFAEARAAARLHHPNIIAVHSLGEDRGFHFIEMEYVEGTSLRQLVQRDGVLSPLRGTRLIVQVARALAAAHAHGVVHRDIKPDNIMVTAGHAAKLGDFGLARVLEASAGMAAGNLISGTPSYMAPELFDGTPASVASDIYSLGATFYALLAGRVPYEARSLAELVRKHARMPVPAVSVIEPRVPGSVCSLIQRLMAKDPAQRPQDAAELAADLERTANTLVDTKELIAEAMQGLVVAWDAIGEGFRFHVPLPGGRRQVVEAELQTRDAEPGEQVLSFWTPCAPARSVDFQYVLELNGRLPFGAISVRQLDGKPFFVMVENHVRSTVDPEEIRASVLNMAEWADHVELRLTGKDVH